MGINNVKLSTRIYFQQIMVVLALIGLGIYSLNNLKTLNEFAVELAEDDFPVLEDDLNMKEKMDSQQIELLIYRYAALMHVVAASENKQSTRNEFENARRVYEDKVAETDAAIKVSEEEVSRLLKSEDQAEMLAMLKTLQEEVAEVKESQKKLEVLAKDVERLTEAGDAAGLNSLLENIFATFVATDKQIQDVLNFSKQDILRSIEKSKEISSDMVDMLFFIVASVSLVAVILTIVTGMSLRTLRKSVEVISGSVQQVATAAAQSGNAISMVSDGAKRQSDSINQAVTAVEQSVTVLAEVSKSAEEATELAKNSGQLVRAGKEKMDAMVRVVNRIEENSNKVNKITEIIGGIASQTNMLALNAAIEAARAGEQGKGFAVVADQVKSLAENSKSSVDDIVTLIEQAKADASEAVLVANNVNQEMEKILESSRTTERMMQNISTAMEEQVSTTEELGQNMDTLRDIGTSNANAAEEITETIIELSRIASDTNQEIKKFNI